MIINGTTAHQNFILDAMLRNIHQTSLNSLINKKYFFDNYTQQNKLLNILNHSETLILVSPEDQNIFKSFLVFEQRQDITIIHYAYTKEFYRNRGYITKLIKYINPQNTLVTHTPSYINLFKVDPKADPSQKKNNTYKTKLFLKKYNLRYDPFILERRYQ